MEVTFGSSQHRLLVVLELTTRFPSEETAIWEFVPNIRPPNRNIRPPNWSIRAEGEWEHLGAACDRAAAGQGSSEDRLLVVLECSR